MSDSSKTDIPVSLMDAVQTPSWVRRLLNLKFDDMPKWVRVSTYLILLFFSIYMALVPRFIYGTCMVKVNDEDAGDAYRGHVGVYVESQLISVEINKHGAWAVPLVSRLPKAVPLQILYLDTNGKSKYKTLEISFLSILFSDRHTIYVTPDPNPEFRLAKQHLFPSGLFSNTAYAQEEPTPARASGSTGQGSTNQPAKSSTETAYRDSVEEEVVSALSSSLQLEPSSLAPQQNFRQYIETDLVKSSLLASDLQKRFDILIDNSSWQNLKTVDDVTRFVEQRTRFLRGIDADVVKALRPFESKDGLYLSDEIPPRKVENAKDTTEMPADEQVIALADGTLLGSARNSILFGMRGVYFRTSWTATGPRMGFISYDDFLQRDIEKHDWSEVSLGSGQYFVVAGSSFKSEELAGILHAVQSALQEREDRFQREVDAIPSLKAELPPN